MTGIETTDGIASCAASRSARKDALVSFKDLLAAVDSVSSDVDDLIEAVNVDVDFDPDNVEDVDTDADMDFDLDDEVFAIIDIDIDIDVVAEPDDTTANDGQPGSIRTSLSMGRGRILSDVPTLADGDVMVPTQHLLEAWKTSDEQDLAPEGRPLAFPGEPAWLS